MHKDLHTQINNIFKEEEVVSVLDCGIYKQDIQCLKQYQWLRSEAITLLCAMFQNQYKALFPYFLSNQKPDDSLLLLQPVKILYPAISSMMIFMGDHDFILQSMEAQNLFSYRYLVMPTNTETNQTGKGSHWFLMIYDTLQNIMWTMDSAYQCVHKNAQIVGQRLNRMKEMFGIDQKRKQQIEKICEGKENSDKLKEIFLKKRSFKASWLKNIIKQQNSYDCGVFTAGNIQRFLQQLNQRVEVKQKKPKNIDEQILSSIKKINLNPSDLPVDPEFFRDLRLRYFSKALNLLKKSFYK